VPLSIAVVIVIAHRWNELSPFGNPLIGAIVYSILLVVMLTDSSRRPRFC
jgi:hypothetical protein